MRLKLNVISLPFTNALPSLCPQRKSTPRRARRLARRAELAKSAKEAVDTAAATAAPAKQEAQDVDVDAAGQHGDHVVDAAGTTSTLFDSVGSADRILRKAETVLQRRTSRIIIVVEKCSLDHNHSVRASSSKILNQYITFVVYPRSTGHRILHSNVTFFG